jgi:hypothetical protein
MGRRGDTQILSLAFFGPAAIAVYYSAFHPPARLASCLAGHVGLDVAAMVVWATLAAYCCRRVVQALLCLCGLG